MRQIKKLRWYEWVVIAFVLATGGLYLVAGDHAHVAIADNLDLFTAQYEMLRRTHTWFSHGVAAPFLGGVSRDVLPSELSLASLIYMIFPGFSAYVVNYLTKVVLGVVSFTLLAKEVLYGKMGAKVSNNETTSSARESEEALIVLMGLAYGALNLFPAFGISFSTIPLGIYFMIRLYRADDARRMAGYLAALLLFPFVSYFSYIGIFLLAYFAVAWIWVTIRDIASGRGWKRAGRILLGITTMSTGCVIFEYRLFGTMLLSDELTIRSTMKVASFSLPEAARAAFQIWRDGMMHCEPMQKYLVLPLCTIYFVWLNVRYLVRKNVRGIFHDLYNLMALILVFNAAIYGLYYVAGFRSFIEHMIPPLEGWQFNRTIFFSPLLWYASFGLMLIRILRAGVLAGHERVAKCMTILLAFSAIFLIACKTSTYNDLRTTLRGVAYEKLKGERVNDLSYGEFYSSDLFEKIKDDLRYREGDFANYHLPGEGSQGSREVLESTGADWAVAYGFHPAVLEYNGIATLDGYLGFYAESYKNAFRAVIAPALEAQEPTRIYFDDWGARCYLYAGDTGTVVEAVRRYPHASGALYADTDALRELGCKYIFSRVEFTNAQDKNLTLAGRYEDDSSPYVVFVYELE